jgi:Domain of unknown function (DUF4932)
VGQFSLSKTSNLANTNVVSHRQNTLHMKGVISVLLIFSFIISCSPANKKSDKEFFVFKPDIRLFTSYTFMNAAGFDNDWTDTLHPIRLEVRNYLDSVLTDDYKRNIHDYYKKLGGYDFYGYGVYALNSKFPPDFELICDTCNNEYLDKFAGYDTLLQDFYVKANIAMLWDKYNEKLHEINLQYKPYADMALRHITSYCRVDPNYYRNIAKGHFYYQQIPLMSHFTAFFSETENDYWIVEGPAKGKPGPAAFYHESLHRIINPIVENNSEINKRIEPLVKLSQEQLKGSYNSDSLILCESLVRTIDKILSSRYYQNSQEELNTMIENEYKLGHILTFYLLENLPDYESSNKTLQEYYPELIANIDLEYEKSRWINYWGSNNNK